MIENLIRKDIYCLLILCVITTFTASVRSNVQPPSRIPWDVLVDNRQSSLYIPAGQTKILKFWSAVNGGSLSFTVTPCAFNIRWSIYLNRFNLTDGEVMIFNMTTNKTFTWRAIEVHQGTYSLKMSNEGHQLGTVNIYPSTETDGPQALRLKIPRLRLQMRRHGQLIVRWNRSAVDPHVTHYCLTASSARKYLSLCEVQREHHLGIKPVRSKQLLHSGEEDVRVACVGSRLKYTLTNLIPNITYNLHLFAVNQQTNFSYPYGNGTYIVQRKLKPILLKDGKSNFANFKVDGRANFQYKVKEKGAKELVIVILPCGGDVFVDINMHGIPVIQRNRIHGYGRLSIPDPIYMQRYNIRVTSVNPEELSRTSGIEVIASTRNQWSLPRLPQKPRVFAYKTFCDAAIVGWLTTPHSKAYYCVTAREGLLYENDGPRLSNQCGLATRMRKSADYQVKYCQHYETASNGSLITQRIERLSPGQNYVVQVTVNKSQNGAAALAYDLLQIRTLRQCENDSEFSYSKDNTLFK